MPAGGLIISSSKHKSALSIYACGCRWKSYYENYICHCPLVLSKLVFGYLENDKRSFSHTSKFVDTSYCKYWARCKLEGLIDGLRYGAKGMFVSINLVSGVPMVSISMLELGLIFARARRPFLRLLRLRALQSFFFTFG